MTLTQSGSAADKTDKTAWMWPVWQVQPIRRVRLTFRTVAIHTYRWICREKGTITEKRREEKRGKEKKRKGRRKRNQDEGILVLRWSKSRSIDSIAGASRTNQADDGHVIIISPCTIT